MSRIGPLYMGTKLDGRVGTYVFRPLVLLPLPTNSPLQPLAAPRGFAPREAAEKPKRLLIRVVSRTRVVDGPA